MITKAVIDNDYYHNRVDVRTASNNLARKLNDIAMGVVDNPVVDMAFDVADIAGVKVWAK